MKKALIVLALVPILFACSPKDNSKHNIALIETYIHAVETLNYNSMNSLLSDSYYGYGSFLNNYIGKKQAVIHWRYNAENLYSSIEYLRSPNTAVAKKEMMANFNKAFSACMEAKGYTVK